MKLIKRGCKVWTRADDSGCICQFEVYTGKPSTTSSECELGQPVGSKLSLSLKDKNYHIFFNNCFSSVPLMKFLTQNQIYGTGTVRSNRKLLPSLKPALNWIGEKLIGECVLKTNCSFSSGKTSPAWPWYQMHTLVAKWGLWAGDSKMGKEKTSHAVRSSKTIMRIWGTYTKLICSSCIIKLTEKQEVVAYDHVSLHWRLPRQYIYYS